MATVHAGDQIAPKKASLAGQAPPGESMKSTIIIERMHPNVPKAVVDKEPPALFGVGAALHLGRYVMATAVAVAGLFAMNEGEGLAAVTRSVEGTVLLPPSEIQEPPTQYPGFVDRIRNQITEIRPFDPRPECFVFLEGGPTDPSASQTPKQPATLELGPESFRIHLLPVIGGTTVTINNIGETTHPIYSPDQSDLLGGPPIGPKGTRAAVMKASDGGATLVRLLSKESLHLEGRIVVLPTRYFSRLARDGSFSIADVPEGKWTMRVWFRDGWLAVTQAVEVDARGQKVMLTLPERLEPTTKAEPAAGAAAGATTTTKTTAATGTTGIAGETGATGAAATKVGKGTAETRAPGGAGTATAAETNERPNALPAKQ
ncbi:MAG: hypothetical protein V2A73_04685 [Pseudomonadota bacterium]